MDRSNSTSSSGSKHGAEPFGYQIRLMERSLSRSNSQSLQGILANPTGGSASGNQRRWAPSHRVNSSIDSVRGKWEERARLEAELEGQGTDGDSSGSIYRTSESTPQPTHRLGRSSSLLVDSFSPSKLNGRGPVPVPSPHKDRDLPELPTTPPHTHITPTKRHTLPASILTSPLSPNNTGISVIAEPTFASSSGSNPHRIHFPRPKSSYSPLSITISQNPKSNMDSNVTETTSTNRSRRSIDFDSILASHSSASDPQTPTPASSSSSLAKQTESLPYSARKRPASLYATPPSPAPLSPDKLKLWNSSPVKENDTSPPSPKKLVNDTYRPPPLSPSVSANSSVMFPTPYRSSYMNSKKASTYGENLTAGRRLGRHLPRIASGDGPDAEALQPPEPIKPLVPQKTAEDIAKTSRLERREQRMRDWESALSLNLLSPTKSRRDSLDGNNNSPLVAGPDDVAGVPGRLRLSKDLVPKSPAQPVPSIKITRGLWVDTQRHLIQAYEYLCHVGEAQQWIEGCLGEELGFGVVEMDEGLRNGVVLAKLVRVFQGENAVRRIYEAPKLDYRHSDNINYFFVFVRQVGLPECFIFELTDLYNKKNIPKVIYCIHALSHLLARRGMAERIGNLLGQLQFSDDQLQQTDRGLKAAGVPIPNFGNIGRELAKEINEEPEVEVETEDERRDRLLLENESSIIAVQSLARSFLQRRSLTTQQARLRLAERYLPRLQARCRGVLTRRSVKEHRSKQVSLLPWVIAMQTSGRSLIARRTWKEKVARLYASRRYVTKLQAHCRGILQRRRFAKLKIALVKCSFSVLQLQSVARAQIARKSHQQLQKTLEQPRTLHGLVALQAVARGVLVRRQLQARRSALQKLQSAFTKLQAQSRGILTRRTVGKQLAKLGDLAETIIRIQAAARCYLARKRLLNLIRGLRKATPAVVALQARARANLQMKQVQELKKSLTEIQTISTVKLMQSFARAALVRKKRVEQSKKLDFVSPNVIAIQAAARGALLRRDWLQWRDHLRSSHSEAVILQALLRGTMQRKQFNAKMDYYRSNLHKVVQIQSLFRGKDTREQYRQLTLGKNVNVGTIKNFVHLLDDSEADFADEIEVERLRKRVVENIRENQALENDVNELDTKIALVVQNVKSFEELIKARRRHRADSAALHAARASILAAHGDPFAGPSALDQATKHKLELYQQLFYLLQTQGKYLSHLFFIFSRSSIADKSKRLAERVVLTLFGYGQNGREEYLLLKLFQMAGREEVDAAQSIGDVMSGHAMYIDVAVHYVRSKQLAYVKDALRVAIVEVVEQDDLDLESDPVVIYRSLINQEEMRSGQRTTKPMDLAFHEAVDDPETRAEFIRHLQKLLALTKVFVKAITSSTNKVPYGMRYVAREMLQALRAKFPNEPDYVHIACTGRLLYDRFINPAIIAPETFDVVSGTLDIGTRKNLAGISKMLTQIASGKIFGDDTPSLIPLNSYVSEAIQEFRSWLLRVVDVPDAEAQFHAHEFLDVAFQPKPIFITPNEVYSMHSILSEQLQNLAPNRDDTLRVILMELGGVPNLGTDELKDARDRAITLELTNRFANLKDPAADEKAFWVQAKRSVLAILRVQPAKDLVESLMSPISEEHEMFWEDIVDREMMNDRVRQRQRRMPSTTGAESAYRLEDVRSLTFREVKAHAIYFLLELEKRGKVTRTDGYQGILNAIAGDVRSKHRKRLQRQQELQSMQQILKHLAERKKYFEEQIASYHSYVEAAMNTMQRGKNKKRFVIPFTKQYFHLRDLQRSGKSPQFGSFRYSAQDLYDKGILLSIDQFSPRQFEKIDLVFSSNKAGVFDIEVYNTASGTSNRMAEAELRIEDLLQAQYENRVSLALCDGTIKVNLNLILYQLNKKFYV